MAEQFELSDNLLKVKNTKNNEASNYKIKEVKLDSPIVNEIRELVTELVDSLKCNGADWKLNDNMLVFNLVTKVVSFVRKFKKMTFENKKNLALNLITKLITEQINKLNLEKDLKTLILTGIDIVIEPSLDLSLMTLENKINLKEKCKCLF